MPQTPSRRRSTTARRNHRAGDRCLESTFRGREAISFASVAREADVSTDFLYRQPQLRQRINQMRTSNGQRAQTAAADDGTSLSTSAPVRALSAQLKELRRRHHKEITDLKEGLAVAHGETLALRRKLANYE